MRIAYYRALSTGSFSGAAPRVVCPVLLVGPGVVRAAGATLGYWPSANLVNGCIHLQTSARTTEIAIGAGSVLNNGTVLMAEGPGIEIGARVLIGRNTEIYDSDRHPLDPALRKSGIPEMGRVVIEDDVFVGSGVKIGKGVRIGRGSVIGMGSVVTHDVPPGVVAAGNPCRVVRPR
jgi:maltose O-acetyltransferase